MNSSGGKIFSLLADLVLFIHFSLVFFLVAGLLMVWLGWVLKWNWVKNFYFRIAHLLLIGWVVVQTLLNRDCPLTICEDYLRVKAGEAAMYHRGCISYWLDRFLFYDCDPRILNTIYFCFFVLVVLSFVFVKPRWIKRKVSREGG